MLAADHVWSIEEVVPLLVWWGYSDEVASHFSASCVIDRRCNDPSPSGGRRSQMHRYETARTPIRAPRSLLIVCRQQRVLLRNTRALDCYWSCLESS